MPATTSLYRFFDSRGDLLYIGVTNRIPRRLDEHHENKPWYHEVAQVKVEHLSDRDTALRTEKAAIETEHPKYNVVHNRGPHRVPSQRDEGVYTHITSWRKSVTPGGRWVFRYLKGRNPERVDLFLYPELAGAPVLDDFYDLTGEEQFEEYIRYVRRHNQSG
jgi:predicted GIY-YIG superfamily endonuclease